jgi:hypothetical protein
MKGFVNTLFVLGYTAHVDPARIVQTDALVASNGGRIVHCELLAEVVDFFGNTRAVILLPRRGDASKMDECPPSCSKYMCTDSFQRDESIVSMKIDSVMAAQFPNSNLFCEAYTLADSGTLLLALNSKTRTESEQGIYRYHPSNGSFRKILRYAPDEVCYRCLQPKRGTYLLNMTTTNEIRLYKKGLLVKNVLLEGLPNDICLNKDATFCYIALNRAFLPNAGMICELRLRDFALRSLVGENSIGHMRAVNTRSLSIVSGIQIHGDDLYIATLMDVLKVRLSNLFDVSVIAKASDYATLPNFDNITVHKSRLYVSIYNYDDALTHFVLSSPILRTLVLMYLNVSGTVWDGNRKPNTTPMLAGSLVHYLQVDCETGAVRYVKFTRAFNNFDKEVTQLGPIDDDTFVMVNYKANRLLFLHRNSKPTVSELSEHW